MCVQVDVLTWLFVNVCLKLALLRDVCHCVLLKCCCCNVYVNVLCVLVCVNIVCLKCV